MNMIKRFPIIIILVLTLSGCVRLRHSVPPDMLTSARVFGMQDIRAFSGSPSDVFKKDFVRLLEQEEREKGFFNANSKRTFYMLAISGGAADGAYGAGILSGWTQSGRRPVFKIVTGISTGAIIAPMAFLGSKYDDTLKEFYTKYSTSDIISLRIPFINSFVNTKPLERLIEKYFDEKLLQEIAAEYNKGRRLYVGTTNLDAQRLVIWDMGKIASIGNGQALKLFRKIILASSSIPVAFPPVYLNVEVNDKTYDEMHVDGGVTKQVFFIYDVMQGFSKAVKEKGINPFKIKYAIYIIRNGYIDPLYKEIPDRLSAIAQRTLDTTINAQSLGDLYQIYIFTKYGHGDFNLAYIPSTYISKATELFDTVEMQRLFDLGFNQAQEGYPWKKVPPGLGEAGK